MAAARKLRTSKLPSLSWRTLLASPYFWAIVLRGVPMLLFPVTSQGDAVDYQQIAYNLAHGHGFSRCFWEPFPPTAQRPPLYPLVLALVYLLGGSWKGGPMIMNLLFDLASMWLARKWAEELKLSWAPKVPWLVALCPLLITYGLYPTSENVSITLFFAALYLTYRARPAAAGLTWGLLSLARSYFLLFPFAFLVFPPTRRWSRRAVALMVAMSFAAPGVWMVRNYSAVHRLAFSQTSTVGWQSYQGLCVANFDWWRPEHINFMLRDPLFSRMMKTHCSSEDEIAEMDHQALGIVKDCVTQHPFDTARNIVIKGINLFVNWGLILPYNRTPYLLQQAINAFLLFYWWCAFQVVRRRKKGNPGIEDGLRFSLVNLAYITAVTIPFAVDARYLLGPFLTMLIVALELSGSPRELLAAGLAEPSA